MTKTSERLGVTFVLLAATMACLGTFSALAQEKFPSRPIEYIVPWGPGGGADQLARLSAKLVEPLLGSSLPVVNVAGATGATGIGKLLAAPADGYSLGIYIADSHALLAGPDARWKADDLVPIAVMVKAPSFLFVASDSRFKSWADFAAEAKAKPGVLKVATLGFGSVDDFTMQALEARGIKLIQVPYAKPSERYVSILGGHADVLYEQAGDVGQFVRGNQMRPIIVFDKQRFAEFKDVPSSHELGIKIALPQFRSIVVKAGTPPDRIKILADAFAKAAASDEYKAFLAEQFASPDSVMGANAAPAFVAEQLKEMKGVAK